MLVLTRKLQEQIRVGDEVTITILRIKGNTVRLGIEAPRGVRVVRGELPSFECGPAVEEGGSGSHPDAGAESAGDSPTEEQEEAPLAAFRSRAAARRRGAASLAASGA